MASASSNLPYCPPCASEPAELAGYRWLLNLAETDINMDGFDFVMAQRLWAEVQCKITCCLNCPDGQWCEQGLDYWMSGIVIFLYKFYGHGMSRQDRMNVRYIRGRFLDSPENRGAMIDFELELMDLLYPVLFRIQNEVIEAMDLTPWPVEPVFYARR